MKRANLLVLAGAVGMLGWGTVLPYQYAYAASSRGWGTLIAAGASSLFSIGALVAAPLGGRLADRLSPVRVAVVAKLVAAVASAALILAGTPVTFLLAMLVFGAGITAAQPAQSVLVLQWVGSRDRRKVFAWQFTASSVGMAIGALLAAQVVDLSSPDGLWPAFAMASAGFLISATLIGVAGLGWRPGSGTHSAVDDLSVEPVEPVGPVGPAEPVRASTWSTIVRLSRIPGLRWVAVVTVLITLGFYAQFESGLPAYALLVLEVPARTIGTAAAVNCLVIVALQMVVVKLTARRDAAALLVVVGSIWVLCWGILAISAGMPEIAATLFVTTYGIFAVGETLFAPVLNPLTASLAPAGMVGTTLGLVAALQTGVSAVGPLLAGVALGAGHGTTFVVAHLVVSGLAVAAALRLRTVLRRRTSANASRSGRLALDGLSVR
ncbi:MFS transporter [Lapillicoccus sp.]|uniref:MFS transporter n=1 Tax=Lapillicoccus sp. TaxID=1909287 RepID=UPI003263FEAF